MTNQLAQKPGIRKRGPSSARNVDGISSREISGSSATWTGINRTGQPSGATPVRRSVIWLTSLMAAGILSGAWIYHGAKRPAESPQPQTVAAQTAKPSAANHSAANNTPDDPELRQLTPEEIANAPRPPAVIQSTSRVAGAGSPPPARAQPTPYTQQLVAGLAQMDFSRGPISPELAAQWKQGLKTLTDQGVASVPAIREFLEKNVDFDYTAVKGAQALGHSSLRAALLDALQQIGGPEATDVMLQTLRTTGLPSEIAWLAEHLEQQAPGQYRQETLNAVNEVLAMSEKGQLAVWDVGALFQVLQKYGDATTAEALAQLQSKWNYYAAMALAGMPGGEGVPALIREAQDAAAGAGGKGAFAFQLLAQLATAYPDAGAALIEQARRHQIPDNAWRKIATGLAGDQYQIGTPPQLSALTPTLPGLKTYHIESGNQNFYSLPLDANLPADQVGQRLALIDQLLASASSPAAVEALRNARALLGTRL